MIKHLIDPLDLSLKEVSDLLLLGEKSAKTLPVIPLPAKERSWPPSFMSPAPVPV